ncbi:MAG: Rho termination factor N-terminal domain-containing protein [Flavobacteriales bacterium]|nr:Rho termination factor N-terminal domain-containing protein [Flavobacteriales bacterium]
MHDSSALSEMKLAELREIAKKLQVKKADTLKKQDLIARILEAQVGKPSASDTRQDTDAIALDAVADEDPAPVPDPEPEPVEEGDDADEDEDEENEEEEEDEEEEESPIRGSTLPETKPVERPLPDAPRDPAPSALRADDRRDQPRPERNERRERGDQCRPVADVTKAHDRLISLATIAARTAGMIDATRGHAEAINNGTKRSVAMISRANKVNAAGTNHVSSNATRETKANGVAINSGTKGNVGTINATNVRRNHRANRSTSMRSWRPRACWN